MLDITSIFVHERIELKEGPVILLCRGVRWENSLPQYALDPNFLRRCLCLLMTKHSNRLFSINERGTLYVRGENGNTLEDKVHQRTRKTMLRPPLVTMMMLSVDSRACQSSCQRGVWGACQ